MQSAQPTISGHRYPVCLTELLFQSGRIEMANVGSCHVYRYIFLLLATCAGLNRAFTNYWSAALRLPDSCTLWATSEDS